ncbi:MAG: FkbM family methyltransferase [Acidobacteriota bacterium]
MSKKLLASGGILVAALAAAAILAQRDPDTTEKVKAFPHLFWTRDHHCAAADAWRAQDAFAALWDHIDEISEGMTIAKTDPAGYELVSVPPRQFWIPRGNRLNLAEVLGEQQEDVYSFRGRGVRPGDVVLDCGANVGAYTRHALDQGARKVVAIEIAPENLECLRRNFAPEIQSGRVIVYPKGVWDHDDFLVLRTVGTQTGSNSVAMLVPGSQEGPRVPLTTIDKLVEELHLDRVDYIKMDIEGSEKKALAGAKNTVARFKPRMAVSLEHLEDDTSAIPALIDRLWPGTKTECGPCVWVKTAHVNAVRPDVLFVN